MKSFTDTLYELNQFWSYIKHVEGGYVNHPLDRGGPTNMGITTATLTTARKTLRNLPISVNDLTEEDAQRIYNSFYYRKGPHLLQLNRKLTLVVLDGHIQHGPWRSTVFAQEAANDLVANLKVDGVLGPKTAAALLKKPEVRFIIIAKRHQFYRKLSTWSTFGKGWTNRLAYLCEYQSRPGA